jgi:hypothetical protein
MPKNLLALLFATVSCVVGCNPGFMDEMEPELEHETGRSELVAAAGAQVAPDLAFVSVSPVQIFHVAKTGNDANPGTAAAPWATMTKAVRTLRPGQAAYVHAGTYSEHLDLSIGVDGTATAPIRLMGAPGEAKPVLLGSRDNTMISASRAYWIFDGLDVNANKWRSAAVHVRSHHVAVRNSLLHNGQGPYGVGVSGGARDVLIAKNKIYDYLWYVSGARKDSHGVDVMPDSERVLIQQNEVYNTTGDGVQCKGVAESGFGTMDPRDVVIEDNRLHHTAENAVDIKSCQRVTIRGGAANSSKFYGFRTVEDTGTNCGGSAIVLHFNARQILVEKNRIWDAGMGITLGRTDALAADIIIRKNLFFNLTTAQNGCGVAVRINRSRNVDVTNNTFDNIPDAAIQVGKDTLTGLTSEYTTLRNNIIRNAGYALDVRNAGITSFSSDKNLFWRTDSTSVPFRVNGAVTNLTYYRSVIRNDATSVQKDPLFVADPSVNDYYLQLGSPGRDTAQNLGGTYCGAGPDMGFLETCT